MRIPIPRRLIAVVAILAFAAVPAGGVASAPIGSISALHQSEAAPYALGTLQETGVAPPDCPTDSACESVTVTCPEVDQPAGGSVAVARPDRAPRGVVVVFSGGGGEGWAFNRKPDRQELHDRLVTDGFVVVQVAWDTGWWESSPGDDAGPARLACRPATVISWIHDGVFLPLGIERSTTGRCGFCITGNSGGSSQVAYALSHYGLDAILDAVIPTSGPPHADLTAVCLRQPEEEAHLYTDERRRNVDASFGVVDDTGPCFRSDPAYTDRWREAGIATGGSDYLHPATRVHVLFGERDTDFRIFGTRYTDRLEDEGTPWLKVEVVPDAGHAMLKSEAGRSALRAAILDSREGAVRFTAEPPWIAGRMAVAGHGTAHSPSPVARRGSLPGCRPLTKPRSPCSRLGSATAEGFGTSTDGTRAPLPQTVISGNDATPQRPAG